MQPPIANRSTNRSSYTCIPRSYSYYLLLLVISLSSISCSDQLAQESKKVEPITEKGPENVVREYFEFAKNGDAAGLRNLFVDDLRSSVSNGNENLKTQPSDKMVNGDHRILDPPSTKHADELSQVFAMEENPLIIRRMMLSIGNIVVYPSGKIFKVEVELINAKGIIFNVETFTVEKLQEGKFKIARVELGTAILDGR